MAFALPRERQVLEGAPATCIALLLHEAAKDLPGPIVFMGYGMNVDMSVMLGIANQHTDLLT